MEEPGGFGPVQEPRLDDSFVLGARYREASHRDRQLGAERARAQERAVRYRQEEDHRLAAAERQGRRGRPRRQRPIRRRLQAARPGAGQRLVPRQILGLAIVVAAVAAAALLPGRITSGPPPLGALAGAVTDCAAGTYPAGAQYRFERCAGGAPVRWPRCSTLTVAVDPAHAPVSWPADLSDALAQLGRATGLHLRTVPGATTGADITVAWTAVLHGGGQDGADDAGLTEARYEEGPDGAAMTSAHIQLRTGLPPAVEPGGEVPVLLHELGHAVGMGHDVGPEVMDPIDQGYATYQSGDLAGLAALYQPLSCG